MKQKTRFINKNNTLNFIINLPLKLTRSGNPRSTNFLICSWSLSRTAWINFKTCNLASLSFATGISQLKKWTYSINNEYKEKDKEGQLTTFTGNFAVQNEGLLLYQNILDVIAHYLDFYIKSNVPQKEVYLYLIINFLLWETKPTIRKYLTHATWLHTCLRINHWQKSRGSGISKCLDLITSKNCNRTFYSNFN